MAAADEQSGTADAALESFARALDAYALTLDDHDRRMLSVLLYRAMTPIDRARVRGETGLLAPEEIALLDRLQREAH